MSTRHLTRIFLASIATLALAGGAALADEWLVYDHNTFAGSALYTETTEYRGVRMTPSEVPTLLTQLQIMVSTSGPLPEYTVTITDDTFTPLTAPIVIQPTLSGLFETWNVEPLGIEIGTPDFYVMIRVTDTGPTGLLPNLPWDSTAPLYNRSVFCPQLNNCVPVAPAVDFLIRAAVDTCPVNPMPITGCEPMLLDPDGFWLVELQDPPGIDICQIETPICEVKVIDTKNIDPDSVVFDPVGPTLQGVALDPSQEAGIQIELVTLVGSLPDSFDFQAFSPVPLLPGAAVGLLIVGVNLLAWRQLRRR
jgi:hypothetical protein